MPTLPRHLKLPSRLERLTTLVSHQLNFYRVHMLAFTFIPLTISGIFYAANTSTHVPYIDCLFICMSSMCVTGLVTINLSTLTTFQQFLVFIQALMGSLIFVSIVQVYVRMHFFRVRFRHIIEEERKRRGHSNLSIPEALHKAGSQPIHALRRRMKCGAAARHNDKEDKKQETPARVTSDMLGRVEGGGIGILRPPGFTLSEKASEQDRLGLPVQPSSEGSTAVPSVVGQASSVASGSAEHLKLQEKQASDAKEVKVPTSPGTGRPGSPRIVPDPSAPRSPAIAFFDADDGMEHILHLGPHGQPMISPRSPRFSSGLADVDMLSRITSNDTNRNSRPFELVPGSDQLQDPKTAGYGGFPTPLSIASSLFQRVSPAASKMLNEKIADTLTVPSTTVISGDLHKDEEGHVPYISFSAVVGRNSQFKDLTEEQLDELGGVEYRALKLLFWIVVSYWVMLPLIGAVIIGPYIGAKNRYASVFESQPKLVGLPWFSIFQAGSAFTNLGMSLVDTSVVPFQRAYLMNAVVALLILAGNTCFPIVLRFVIWILYKTFPKTSSKHETLKFLLDHPRRCFVYLFPSTATWFLFWIVFIFSALDFVSFMVLDIGTPVIEAIPPFVRVAAAYFQCIAVRAAGFTIVPMNQIAPAVKVLFVIMMYISVYPIAMSVRSTNVYEERSLGLFEDIDEEAVEAALTGQQGATAVAKYLGWHARRQLAFDMWWIGASLWIVCIIERSQLNDPAKYEYFNVFNVMFELVSAYGTVGLSLGVAKDNYSLVGEMRTLSKLVICGVMLRGRHRGLPVAIDRAVMIPRDFTASDEAALESRLRRSRRTQNTSMANYLSHVYSGMTASPATARHPSPTPTATAMPTASAHSARHV